MRRASCSNRRNRRRESRRGFRIDCTMSGVMLEADGKKPLLVVAAIFLTLTSLRLAHGETREQWIELGARIHGAFGAFIPVGIRLGLDAKEKLNADARGLSVTFYNGEKPPCPCVGHCVMISKQASPGQGAC